MDQALIMDKKDHILTKDIYTKEELMIDASFDLERMNKFMELPTDQVIETLEEKYEFEEIARIAKPTIIDEKSVPIGYDHNYSVKDKRVDYDQQSSDAENAVEVEDVEAEDQWFEVEAEVPLLTENSAMLKETSNPDEEFKEPKKRKGKLESALSQITKKKKK